MVPGLVNDHSRQRDVSPPPSESGNTGTPECLESAGSGREPLEVRIAALGGGLASGFGRVLEALPGAPLRPSALARTLGLDAMLSSRLLRATGAADAMAVVHLMPGPEPLRRILKAAERKRVDPETIAAAAAAVDAFERLIESEAGDRAGLDAMISAFLPEAREKHELATKQAAFRANAQVRGTAAEAVVATYFLHSNANDLGDLATLFADLGLRRVRPGTHLGFAMAILQDSNGQLLNLDKEEARDPNSLRLSPFCSMPVPEFATTREGNTTSYWIAGDEVGLKSSVDLVMAEYRRRVVKPHRTEDGRLHAGVLTVFDTPCKRGTMDVFVHKDLYPGVMPELLIYETVPRGYVSRFGDPAREQDRLHFHESIRPLGLGTASARLAHVSRYVEMLDHVCERLGWDAGVFRGYRLDVEYPIYGAQYMIGFKLPEAAK